jgi:hypothetical protein
MQAGEEQEELQILSIDGFICVASMQKFRVLYFLVGFLCYFFSNICFSRSAFLQA